MLYGDLNRKEILNRGDSAKVTALDNSTVYVQGAGH